MTEQCLVCSKEVRVFLDKVRTTSVSHSARLIFALDATASREPMWDMACSLQAEMFREVAAIGGLSVQLVYYRGVNECRASRWTSEPQALAAMMERIYCRGGKTQITKVLAHAKRETGAQKVAALVFVGDAMEENPDDLCVAAAELGRLDVPAFMFHEGDDERVEQAFRDIASLSKGAYAHFDEGAARQLGELLKAVAVFAIGGMAALEGRKDAVAARLLEQMRR